MFKDYLLLSRKEELLNILQDEEEHKHYTLTINFVELFEKDPALGNLILSGPEETLSSCNQTIREAERTLIADIGSGCTLIHKHNVHLRIYGLPDYPELHKVIFPKNEDLGLFLQISGTVVRMTTIKMLEFKREYMCVKCKYKMYVEGIFELKYMIVPPKRCLNPEFCKGTNIIVSSTLDGEHCRDYQEAKIQEQVSKLEIGSMPNTMWITLEDDLVDVCKPGDSVTICGIVKRRWQSPVVGKKVDVKLVLQTNHIQVNNDSGSLISITSDTKEQFDTFWECHKSYPLHGRDMILRSFCPQIYGMHVVKLAVATVLAGGSTFQRDKDTGIRTRTEPHLLLVGDPGTGKSQMLRYASTIIQRSILTTGVGSTSAGLTVAAVMEEGEWQLEGGALVLADGGICCIDEFNSMKQHDRTSIHEAMEQQTISVAKASIVCKLNTRCSILAATNPKVPLDSNQPLTINVALASPLLSRFDLILFLKDEVDDGWDEKVADYILRGHKRKSKFFDDKHRTWSTEMLQAYFLIIKKLNPTLTPRCTQILRAYYQLQRKAATRNKARTTVRLLDSLVRLSQAHARLMYHKEVEVMDAVTAVSLVEISMQGDARALSLDFDAHADFPEDSMEHYKKLVHAVLEKLELFEILESELQMLRSCEDNGFGVQQKKTRDTNIVPRIGKPKNVIDVTVSQIEAVVFNPNNREDEIARSKKDTTETFSVVENEKTMEQTEINQLPNLNGIENLIDENDFVSSTQIPTDGSKKRKFVCEDESTDLNTTEMNFRNSDGACHKHEGNSVKCIMMETVERKQNVSNNLQSPKMNVLKKCKSIDQKSFSNKTDSGNFSDSQSTNIFECHEDEFDDLKLDI